MADPIYTLAFEGLWVYADREGRLEDRPIRLKADIFPYRDVSMAAILDWLAENGFIARYKVGGIGFIQIENFLKHQNPHIKEAASTIPAPCNNSTEPVEHHASTVQAPELPERAGLIPLTGSLIPLTGCGSMAPTAPVDNSAPPQLSNEFREAVNSRPDLDPENVWANFWNHYKSKPEKRTLAQWRKWVHLEHISAAPPLANDPDTKANVEALAARKGLPAWDGAERWADYKARVRAAPMTAPKPQSRDKWIEKTAVKGSAHAA